MVSLSVAMCTFDGAPYVAEQLRSILDQSRLPEQVVVADDGSQDGTPGIVEDLIATAPGFRTALLLGERPLGVLRNFERAVSECSGDVIALSDQDDRWDRRRLATIVPLFEADPDLLLVYGDARLIDSEGKPLGRTLFGSLPLTAAERELGDEGDVFRALIRRNIATGATVVFRRRLLDWALPFPDGWVHDEWLAIIAAAAGHVHRIDELLVDYRQHSTNQIGVSAPTLRRRASRMLEPRGDRYLRLAERSRALVTRLDGIGASPEVRRLAERKLRFENRRARLPRARIARLPAVARGLLGGDYGSLSSQGVLDVARDLLQPA